MRCLVMTMLPLALGMAPPALAASSTPQSVLAHYIASFNKGDMAAAASDLAAQSSIIDEYAPYHWQGGNAFADWGKSYDADAKAKGITGGTATIAPATRTEIGGGHAMIIAPATFRFNQKGVKMIERAQITVTFDQGATGWKISSWTWTGPAATLEK